MVNDCESKSNAPVPLSPAVSKSCAVTFVSTQSLTAADVGIVVSLSFEPIPSLSITKKELFKLTAPLDTVNCELLNDARPLFDVLASSPAIVIVLSDTVVSIPYPPVKVKVSPVENESFDPLSAANDKLDTTVPKLN